MPAHQIEEINMARPIIFLIVVLTLLIQVSCNKNPTGPAMVDERKIALFCLLDPTVLSPTVLVQRTLTFKEANSRYSGNLMLTEAQGHLRGPEGEYELVALGQIQPTIEDEQLHLASQFLGGSSSFNFVVPNCRIEPGVSYDLALSHPGYETVHARTQVPGPFQVTEISIDPDLASEPIVLRNWHSSDATLKPTAFRVNWSTSAGAAGYLVDLVLLEYDIPKEYQLDSTRQEPGRWWQDAGDSSLFVSVPYKEMPLDLGTAQNPQRGILSRKNSLEISLEKILALLGYPRDFNYRFHHTLRLRVAVSALDQPGYDYFAFQYLPSGEGDGIIGQQVFVPDITNVVNGVGIFAAANTVKAVSRVYDFILQPDYYYPREFSFWYEHFNDAYSLDQITHDSLSRRLFPQGLLPPQLVQPDNDVVINPALSHIEFSWEPVAGSKQYLVVLKPKYLWFNPANLCYWTRENHLEVPLQDLPYRDCLVEWYVKAFWSEIHVGAYVAEVSSDKSSLVYSNEVCTPWSESRFFTLPAGQLSGFADIAPTLVSPQNDAETTVTAKLAWQQVAGADAYLLYIFSDRGDTAISVSRENQISPPFPTKSELADGLVQGFDAWDGGVNYTWQICALRVESGALGFSVVRQQGDSMPVVRPRYQHPSGVIRQSQWSMAGHFMVH